MKAVKRYYLRMARYALSLSVLSGFGFRIAAN